MECPPPTPDELTALDLAIHHTDACNCGQRIQRIDNTISTRCALHQAIAQDTLLRARLVALRRDAGRLWLEEVRPIEEGY